MKRGGITKVVFMQVNDIKQVKQIEQECRLSAWSLEDYKKELNRNNSVALVLKQNGKILGFLIARLIKPGAEIYNIAVKLEHQNQGLGQELLNRFLEICLRKSIKEIWLEVRESNKKAIEFYSRKGFEFVYLRKNFYSSPEENGIVLKHEILNGNSN